MRWQRIGHDWATNISLKKNEESYHCWKFPGCQWLGLGTLTASDPGSIPVGKLKSWKPCGVAKKKKRERKRRKKIVVLFLGNIVVVYLWFFFSPPFRLSTLYFNTLYFNFYVHYSMLNTKSLVSIHHHTVNTLYSFCPPPFPLVNTAVFLCLSHVFLLLNFSPVSCKLNS